MFKYGLIVWWLTIALIPALSMAEEQDISQRPSVKIALIIDDLVNQ
ncbi:MAG: hypothetical protein KZQ63_08830 [Candidatus Thiodiazotropha sp. (ex Lucinoma aequizonata)]|nr:hypothetical protein [Candidatus Thiodiazotropha sp. (ex Lucinoma aequizonata)]